RKSSGFSQHHGTLYLTSRPFRVKGTSIIPFPGVYLNASRELVRRTAVHVEERTHVRLGRETVRTLGLAVDDRIETFGHGFVDHAFELTRFGAKVLDIEHGN